MKIEEIIEQAKARPCPIRQSTMKDCRKCRRYFMLKHRWGLQRKGSLGGLAASLGQIVHKLMEYGSNRLPEVRKWLREEQCKILERIDAGEDLDGSLSRRIQELTDAYAKAEAVTMLYWTMYPTSENIERVADEQVIEVEWEGIPLQGRIDKIVRNGDGQLWLRDYKTSSRPLALIGVGYQYSVQCRFYRLLANLKLAEDVKGFVLDKMRMPGIKFCKKDASFEAYVERCRLWYEGLDEPWAASEAILYNEPMVPQELENAIRDTHLFATMDPVPAKFDRDVTLGGCTNPFGNKACPYYDLCATFEKGWQDLIEDKFIVAEVEEEPESSEDSIDE